MDIVKKNLVSIICGVVAIVAMVLLFFPVGGFYEDLQAKLEQRKQDHGKLTKLNSDGPNVKMPIVQPGVTEAPALGQFPTDAAIKKGEELVEQMAKQSEGVMKKAIDRNRRAPLVPQAFPRPRGAALPQFKQAYHAKMREGFRTQLRAVTPPTPNDVALERDRLWNDEWLPKVPVGPNGQRVNENVVKQQFEDEVAPTVADRLRWARSQAGAIYVHEATGGNQGSSVSSFDVHKDIPRVETQQIPSLVDAWAAQLGLWVQEDVVKTILDTNAARGPVAQLTTDRAIVKRLVNVTVPPAYVTRTGLVPIGGANQGVGRSPAGVSPDMAGQNTEAPEGNTPAALVTAYQFSPTGRVCNPLYDVVHFSFTVDIEADQYQTLLANLTTNRFITIRGLDMIALDLARYQAAGLVYGSKPVIQLVVHGETIFFRDWTKPIMPEPVQLLLGIPQTPPPGAVARN